MSNSYARACTEILEILKYIPKEEFDKIPKEKINMYEKNKDPNYNYKFNPSIPLGEQEISTETNAMIVILFRDYFATENQKEKLKEILNNNDKVIEEKKKEKYSNDIFKNKNIKKDVNKVIELQEYIIESKKENIFIKLINKIKKIFCKK